MSDPVIRLNAALSGRRVLFVASLLFLPLGCGGNDDPTGPSFATSKIAFDSDRDGNREIYVMDADGSNPVRLTSNATSDRRPAWSPDGSKIAFMSDRDGNLEIYVMDADGSNQVRLTNYAMIDSAPSWSPDGSKIAFYQSREEGNFEIYVMDADGSNQVRLTNSRSRDRHPSWSLVR